MENMENVIIDPRPLDAHSGWEASVEAHSAAVAEAYKREKHERMLRAANARREKRIKNLASALCAGLAMILAGGIYLNHVPGFPVEVSIAVIVLGCALMCFTLGWICGRSQHNGRREYA